VSEPLRVTYLGHATTLVELDGVRLLTDPLLCRRVAHLGRLWPLPEPALWREPDAVLISHLHLDHLDLPSLRRIGPVPVMLPAGAGRLLRGWPAPVVELSPGDEASVGGVVVRATPAAHDGRRPPFGPRSPALGFVVRGSQSVYFAGDTDLFPGMSQLAPLDAALLPVAGFAPRLGPGHMDARRAAEALRLLRPRLAVPIHWGTLCPIGMGWRRWAYLVEPPHAFARHAAELAPDVLVRVLQPAEAVELPPAPGPS
jgi:L-ascorbate metabolism protein UlaG (beta-lactamase superfamily)